MRLPTYFISHGGGPWPWVEDLRQRFAALESFLRALPTEIGADPAAVLMVSAHWEAPQFSVMAQPRPGMLYDYGGFPAHTYEILYPAPGDPALADRVRGLIESAGWPVRLEHRRGFDHGAFVPLALMYPQAQVPVVQLSLKAGLDAAEHLALGRALSSLRDEGVLIVGSGASFHNFALFNPAGGPPSQAFDAWLQQAVVASPPAAREALLAQWEQAPAARQCHAREEHLIPLMVAAGAASGDAATCCLNDVAAFGLTASSFVFGAPVRP